MAGYYAIPAAFLFASSDTNNSLSIGFKIAFAFSEWRRPFKAAAVAQSDVVLALFSFVGFTSESFMFSLAMFSYYYSLFEQFNHLTGYSAQLIELLFVLSVLLCIFLFLLVP